MTDDTDTTNSICPICCEAAMTDADRDYPLHCQTKTCHFRYCRLCIQNLLRASEQGYSEASDGSKQVKVALQCPQCRASYSTTSGASARSIVQAVLLLRHAAELPLPSLVPDHELKSSLLAARTEFIESTGYDALKKAVQLLQDTASYTSLDATYISKWKPFLHSTALIPSPTLQQQTLVRDPTLLYGWDQFLTCDEQEYITRLLVANKTKFLEQAAHLLHAVMTSGQPPLCTPTPRQVEHTHRVRKLYPLPRCMPRCITLGPYDALANKPFQFRPVTLEILRASGPAARLGVRRGDTITHLQGQAVERYDQYVMTVQQHFATTQSNLHMTLNADTATAQALFERSCQMQNDRVQFL